MEETKRVLILTVTAGNGHNACAKAMANELQKAGAEVKVIDFLKEWSDSITSWSTDKGYNIAAAYFLYVYNASFRKLKRRSPERRYMLGLAQKSALSGAKGLLKEVFTYRPDIIYCTHLYPAIALSDMRMLTTIPATVYISSLDYMMSPFWESCIGVDFLNLPSEDFTVESLRLGYRKEQLLYCGIPIDAKFLAPANREEARERLGIRKDLFTVMVMFGGGLWSGGYKIFRQTVRALKNSPAQIIMLNGRNEKEKQTIDREIADGDYAGLPIANVGFTDAVELYMAAADVIVTKLGGLSSTECMACRRPIVAAKKYLVANEAENAAYLCGKGAALMYRNQTELTAALNMLRTNEQFYENICEAQAKLIGNGVESLAKHILSQPKADYDGAAPPERKRIKKGLTRLLKEADKATRLKLKGKTAHTNFKEPNND